MDDTETIIDNIAEQLHKVTVSDLLLVYDLAHRLAVDSANVQERRSEWMKISEVAEYAGRSRSSVNRAIEADELHPVMPKGLTKGKRIRREEVERWVRGL